MYPLKSRLISLKFIFENGDEKFYYSDYIPVLVRKSDINESIKAVS